MEEAPFGDALNEVACSDRLAVFSQQGACIGKTKGRKAKPAEGKGPSESKAKAAPSKKSIPKRVHEETSEPRSERESKQKRRRTAKAAADENKESNRSDIPKGSPKLYAKRKLDNCKIFAYVHVPVHAGEQPTA